MVEKSEQSLTTEPIEDTIPEPITDLDNPEYFINRELSLIDFQWRVFEEVQDKSNPLLERIKFLSIVGSNMDEFFMIRVGGLKMQHSTGMFELSIDGLTPAEQLALIRKESSKLFAANEEYFHKDLIPELKKSGIFIMGYDELNKRQKESVDNYFEEVIFPVLTPLAFDPGHPFPHISNLSLNLAILIQDKNGENHFARVKVPASLPRLLPIKRSSGATRRDGTVPHNHYFVWLEEVIAANLEHLFPGMIIKEVYPFRVIRNADFEIQEIEALDLLETMAENVRKRRFGNVVCLMVNEDMPDHILDLLIQNLDMDERDVYKMSNHLGFSSLMQIFRIDRYDLKYKTFRPAEPPAFSNLQLKGSDIFESIRKENIFLHHPYHSFDPVITFLKAASRDPDVLTIKQTLYRVGSNAPIVETLLDARREHSKQVAALVELKARFDEESNIGWAKKLEREGVHVTYGLMGLKTHSKMILVVRKEGEHIRRYVHIGTGNYNATTARLYEDIGVFTCDEATGADVTDVFNYLTGYSSKEDYQKLLVAPINLRGRFEELIRNEIKLGKKGRIILKMNSLTDKELIHQLYEASQAGVEIDLIIRGMNCLKAGIPGVSENIRVRSIVGRFLEHSRIYYFGNNGDEVIYIGSADIMPRNLDRRVEVLFPIQAKTLIRHIRDMILETYLHDNAKCRIQNSGGSYEKISPDHNDTPVNSQSSFLEYYISGTMGED